MQRVYNPKDVARLVGISYRQIQYWDASGFIQPSHRRRGRFRFYTFEDLILLRVAQALRMRGMSVQRLRTVIGSLQGLIAKLGPRVREATFMIEDGNILVFTGEVLMSRRPGPEVFEFRVPELALELEAEPGEAPDDAETVAHSG